MKLMFSFKNSRKNSKTVNIAGSKCVLVENNSLAIIIEVAEIPGGILGIKQRLQEMGHSSNIFLDETAANYEPSNPDQLSDRIWGSLGQQCRKFGM